jgi:hypothetical protein
MGRPVRRTLTVVQRGLGAALCGLAAHGALYRSLVPTEGAHGYFGWYEQVIAALSVVAVLAVALVVASGLVGRPRLPVEFVGALVRRPGASPRIAGPFLQLVGASLLLLVAQESAERSVESGGPTVAAFAPTAWLVMLAAISLLAVALVVATRSCAVLLRWVCAGEPRPVVLSARPVAPSPLGFAGPRRRNPLACGRALRAPPLLAG